MGKKTLVFVPTYNERENVTPLYEDIKKLGLGLDILFLYDNSPDGTAKVIDAIASNDEQVPTIHRAGKEGIGSAHQEGIKWAYGHGYETLITMDCDFTHDPAEIPGFIKASEGCDIVVGSRYMLRDSLAGWDIYRKALTNLGHFMTKHLLKMPYDASGAFRLYRLNKIPRHAFDLVSSRGYSFFYESLFVLNFNKFSIKEIPIRLPARTSGHSKMRLRDIWISLKFLFSIYINVLFNKEKYLASEPFVPTAGATAGGEWDDYWKSQKGTGGLVYDAAAAFYRKFIIKRALNHFIKKYFKKGAEVLHAGCGGGQVDADIREYVSITAMDISVNALSFYKRIHGDSSRLLHGSIFDIPLPEGSMDGVYNLGVMEHYTEEDIQRILKEFKRILKPGGLAVIFWPPEFGLSVIFFKCLKIILRPFFGKGLKFHPDETTRIRSKRHARGIFERAGFNAIKYYFGVRDFFTYAVIVVGKPV